MESVETIWFGILSFVLIVTPGLFLLWKKRRASGQSDNYALRVLLVDDIAMNLKVHEAILKQLCCSYRSAQSGGEALAQLENFVPDWVLTDMWMPDMTGSELADRIRVTPECGNAKIVAITADPDVEKHFNTKKFDAIILKPLTVEKVKSLFYP